MSHSMQQEGIAAAVEPGEPEEEDGEEVGGRRLLRLRRRRVPRQDRQHREEEKEQARWHSTHFRLLIQGDPSAGEPGSG